MTYNLIATRGKAYKNGMYCFELRYKLTTPKITYG